MNIRRILSLTIILSATIGECANSFTEIDYGISRQDVDFRFTDDDNQIDLTTYSISSTYYFDGIIDDGPIGSFSFIQKSNLLGFSLSSTQEPLIILHSLVPAGSKGYEIDEESNEIYGIKGRYYIQNFFVDGLYQNDTSEDISSYKATLGCLLWDRFEILGSGIEADTNDSEQSYQLGLRYSYEINTTDYLGVEVFYNETLEANRYINLTYFKSFQNGTYVKTKAGIDQNGDWMGAFRFYYNESLSVSFQYDKEERSMFGIHYFINDNIGIGFSYSNQEGDYVYYSRNIEDKNTYKLAFTGVF